VHDYVADHSDLFAGDSGRQGLIAGDTFEIGDTSPGGIGPLTRIDVISINEQTLTATIGATVRPDRRPAPAGPSRLLFGAGDGVGIAVSPNGTIVQVEPHLPLIRVLDDVVALQSTESIASGVLRDQVRRQTLQSLRDKVNAELERLDGYRSPAPPAAQTTTSTDGAVEPGAVSVGD
jgi:hypothetical protein